MPGINGYLQRLSEMETAMYSVNSRRVIDTFLECVKIPSPSWKEENMILYIENAAAALGYASERSVCRNSWNLIVRVPGDSDKKPVLFAAHNDTVMPCDAVRPVETAAKIMSDGTSILGGDDKAAVAAFIEAMTVLKEQPFSHPPVEFLFTCAEEVGLCGMKGMDYSRIKSKYGYVFDCSGSIGTMILRAPSQIILKAEVTGKAAHAGIEPEKGINAIRAAARIISKLPDGRLDKETTANVGIISGGRATNIVSEKAFFEMEMRSLDKTKLKALDKKIRQIIIKTAAAAKAKVKIVSTLEYTGFSISKTDPVVTIVEKAAALAGVKPVYSSSGGGSDTNVLNAKGIRAVNLSIGMSNVHTTKEYILKKDIIKGTELVLAILASA
jgi:tripeptide aminopeptidase